jgi:hypothetical protein
MTFELPEPACPKSGTRQPQNLYTEAQLLQVRRDALEEAAVLAQETICDTHIPTGINIYGTRAAHAIRKLKDETK